MTELELFWFPGTCARVPLIALEEAAAPVATRLVVRWDRTALAAYRRDVNPTGKLPTLLDGGQRIAETLAILVWLDRRFPDARLLPREEPDATDALSLMSFFASGIHRAISRLRWPVFVNDDESTFQRTRELAAEELADSFGVIEARLGEREWLLHRWTILDGYLLWLWFKAVGSGFDGRAFPRLAAHAERCERRPSVQRALEREVAAYEQIKRSMPAELAAMPGAVGSVSRLASLTSA